MKSFIKKQQFNYIKRCLFDLNNAFINCSDPNIINVSKLIAQDKILSCFDKLSEGEKEILNISKITTPLHIDIYLNDLKSAAAKYTVSLETTRKKYKEIFEPVSYAVNSLGKTKWTDFSEEEKTATQTAVCLVGLLYKMCQVSLVNKASEEKDMNTVNHSAIDESIKEAELVLVQNGL